MRYEVSAETYALLREARMLIADQVGHGVDDDEFLAELARGVLSGAGDPGRATHQIALTTCEHCQRGFQDGAGEVVEVDPAALERARCDAQEIGNTHVGAPVRATQDVSPATRRLVFRRDHGRCVVPGCRSARYLEVHHLVPRAAGGGHEPSKLVLVCGLHHGLHHEGKLAMQGQPGALRCQGLERTQAPDTRWADACSALRNLQFSASDARAALSAAGERLAPDASLEVMIKGALKVLTETRRAP